MLKLVRGSTLDDLPVTKSSHVVPDITVHFSSFAIPFFPSKASFGLEHPARSLFLHAKTCFFKSYLFLMQR